MQIRRLSNLSLFGLTLTIGLSLLAGCSKSEDSAAKSAAPAVPAVPAAGASATAAAISSHLEFGGEFYTVIDVKGDVEKMGGMIAEFLDYVIAQTGVMPPGKLDTHALFKKLGFYNVEGVGLSSWKGSDGLHHNRSFLYTPQGRVGLLKIFGDKPGPFVTPSLAPADSDLVIESTVDLKSFEELLVSIVRDMGGPAAAQEITDNLKEAIPGTTITGQSIVDRLNTRVIVIVRADTKQILPVGPGAKIPLTDFVIALDGFADIFDQLAPILSGNPMVALADKDGMKTATVELPVPDPFTVYKPMLIADPKSKRLYFVSREAFANETVFGQGPRLTASEDYKTATAGLPTEGNALTYFSKKGAAAFVQYYDRQTMAGMPPTLRDSLIDFGGLEKIPHGLASVQTNLPDGILMQGDSTRSPKDVVLFVPVVVGGLFAAMAIPAYSRVQQASAMKAAGMGGSPTEVAIRNNLRDITTAAFQYMLDKGVTEVRFQDLTAGPTPYVHDINSIAGEDYNNLVIRQTTTRISVTTADGRIISIDM